MSQKAVKARARARASAKGHGNDTYRSSTCGTDYLLSLLRSHRNLTRNNTD